MRPHRLRLTAFGPFADTVEVDLDALAAGGLFLLHGDTGAGKTTLLDALGFALFGSVPGVRQKARRLRSDHAADTVRTNVELEVTLSGRRMRVQRWPQQERRKSRGEGRTTEPARVQLDELVDGCWAPVSTRVGEADAELARLLGMSAEQFFQVVLLPQGEFAQFLRADSTRRGELLDRLFGTARFGFVETWLAARRQESAREREAAEAEVELLRARAAQAAGVEPDAKPCPSGWGEQLLTATREALCEAQDELVRCDAARRAAGRVVDRSSRLAQLALRREQLQERERALAGRQEHLDALAQELQTARRADAVREPLVERGLRATELDRAGERVAEVRAGLGAVGLARDADLGALHGVVRAGHERRGALEALRGLAHTVERERRTAAEASTAARLAQATAERCTRELEALPERRGQAEAAVAVARAAAVLLPALRHEREQVGGHLADAAAYAAEQDELTVRQAGLTAAREQAVGLRERAQDLRESRVDAMVAELAAQLVDGDPCPVCGALDHPDPSEVRGDRVTRDDEDEARAAADAAMAWVDELAQALAAGRARSAALLERLAGSDPRGLAGRQAELDAEIEGRSAELAGLTQAEQLLRALHERQAVLQRELATARSEMAHEQLRAGDAALRADQAAARLAEQIGGAPDLDAALATEAARVHAAAAAVAAGEQHAQAAQELERATATLAEALAGAGFSDAGSAQAALRSRGWLSEAEAELRTAADERAGVDAQLAAPDLADPELAGMDAAGARERAAVAAADLADAERDLTGAVGREATARTRAETVARLVPDLRAALDRHAAARATADGISRLADLCGGGGQNSRRMTLSSFVLAARLEEVADAASTRLLRMTQGRYRLVHTDETSRGGARSGLGLLARDAWTGQDRDTSTLSGGETFLASLALALGLADVVCAEAGGARIDALFVDEGFGSLDEDTLEEVMDVLDGLREGGRVVGVVSHVSELRSRIPAQIQVRKGRAGSALTVCGC